MVARGSGWRAAIWTSRRSGGYPPNINREVLPQTLKTAFATGQLQPRSHHEWHEPRRMAAVRRAQRTVGPSGHREELPEHDLFNPRGIPALGSGYRGRVPAECVSQPICRPRRGRDRRDFRLSCADHRSVGVELRPTFGYELNDENAPENFLPPASV